MKTTAGPSKQFLSTYEKPISKGQDSWQRDLLWEKNFNEWLKLIINLISVRLSHFGTEKCLIKAVRCPKETKILAAGANIQNIVVWTWSSTNWEICGDRNVSSLHRRRNHDGCTSQVEESRSLIENESPHHVCFTAVTKNKFESRVEVEFFHRPNQTDPLLIHCEESFYRQSVETTEVEVNELD